MSTLYVPSLFSSYMYVAYRLSWLTRSLYMYIYITYVYINMYIVILGEQSRRAVHGPLPGRGAELVRLGVPEELQQHRDPDQEEQVFLRELQRAAGASTILYYCMVHSQLSFPLHSFIFSHTHSNRCCCCCCCCIPWMACLFFCRPKIPATPSGCLVLPRHGYIILSSSSIRVVDFLHVCPRFTSAERFPSTTPLTFCLLHVVGVSPRLVRSTRLLSSILLTNV